MAVRQVIQILIEDADRLQVGVRCDSKKVMDFLHSGSRPLIVAGSGQILTGGEQLAVVMLRAAKQYVDQYLIRAAVEAERKKG